MRPRPRNEVRKIELKLFELDEPMKTETWVSTKGLGTFY